MINNQTPPNELARQIVEAAEPAADRPLPDAEADMPAPVTARYSAALDPMQQTLAMLSGATPRELAQQGQRSVATPKARRADPKAKAKRKQAKASRARNRR